MARVNRFKDGLSKGRKLMGCWCSMASPIVAEILAGADLDFAVIDMEHGPSDLNEVLAQLQAMNGGNAHPVVRVPTNDRFAIRRLADLGVDSFIVPMVGSAAEARHAVESALYPPAGARGMAGSLRGGQYGRWKTYGADANAGMCVLIQIESQSGLDNLDAIVAVPGLGGIVLGPADLSNSMGFVGQPYHPKVMEALPPRHRDGAQGETADRLDRDRPEDDRGLPRHGDGFPRRRQRQLVAGARAGRDAGEVAAPVQLVGFS